jgi:hypothetical protein
MNVKLIGASLSKDQLAKMIGDYFYSKEPFDLRQEEDGAYSVLYPKSSPRAGITLKNYRVIVKKGRYRFELIIEEN